MAKACRGGAISTAVVSATRDSRREGARRRWPISRGLDERRTDGDIRGCRCCV